MDSSASSHELIRVLSRTRVSSLWRRCFDGKRARRQHCSLRLRAPPCARPTWDIVFTCVNGLATKAHACQEVEPEHGAQRVGAAPGFALGIASAVIIDAAVLSHETVRDEPRLVPTLQVGRDATLIGVIGSF